MIQRPSFCMESPRCWSSRCDWTMLLHIRLNLYLVLCRSRSQDLNDDPCGSLPVWDIQRIYEFLFIQCSKAKSLPREQQPLNNTVGQEDAYPQIQKSCLWDLPGESSNCRQQCLCYSSSEVQADHEMKQPGY